MCQPRHVPRHQIFLGSAISSGLLSLTWGFFAYRMRMCWKMRSRLLVDGVLKETVASAVRRGFEFLAA